MGAFLAIAFGIIVFAMLVNSGERIKKKHEDDKEDSKK